MLASPSICPPERKKTSIRPWPAQSKSSRPPSVKKLCAGLVRSDAWSRPPERWRARRAAVAGIGDCAPAATWRASAKSRISAIARTSSSRARGSSRGAAGIEHVLVEIATETLLGRGAAGVFGKVRAICRIALGERKRPGAALGNRHRLDVEGRDGAGGGGDVGEEVAFDHFLDRDEGAL